MESHTYNLRRIPRNDTTEITSKYALAANIISAGDANVVMHPDTGIAQEYRHPIKGPDKEKWTKSFSNEFVRLAQGAGNRIAGTNTIFITHKKDVPFEIKKGNLWENGM